MMTQKEVIKKIIEGLQHQLNAFGFKAKISEQGFIRNDNHAIYFYYFRIYNRTNTKTAKKGYLVEPCAEINIPEIEKFYQEITLNKELKSVWDFVTLGNTLADLIANPDGINRKRNQSLELYVFEDDDVRFVITELLKYFKNVALSYFLTNNTIEKVDQLLNKHPMEYCVHLYNDLFRFIKGIIAAKLNRNPQLEYLLTSYSNLIIERDMPKNCIDEMERLKSILPMIVSEK